MNFANLCSCRPSDGSRFRVVQTFPSDRQVRDLARQCYAQVEAEILKTIRAAITDTNLKRCQSIVRTQ